MLHSTWKVLYKQQQQQHRERNDEFFNDRIRLVGDISDCC